MKKIVLLTLLGMFAFSCTPSPDQLKKVIEENPEIVFNAIEKNPADFIETVNKAVREAQSSQRERQAQAESERMEEEFKNPKEPKISKGRAIFGNPKAPITIVEYSDFQCPFCTRGYQTISQVKKEYGDKVRVVYKHLPLDFHEMAMPAAQYFEALVLQDEKKAEKFHDMVFENQSSLNSDKEGFLKSVAKKVGANMTKLMKDIESDAVKERIQEDMQEAKEYGFSGTPGFLINGVSLKGAYPFDEFKKIIDRHLGDKDNSKK